MAQVPLLEQMLGFVLCEKLPERFLPLPPFHDLRSSSCHPPAPPGEEIIYLGREGLLREMDYAFVV